MNRDYKFRNNYIINTQYESEKAKQPHSSEKMRKEIA